MMGWDDAGRPRYETLLDHHLEWTVAEGTPRMWSLAAASTRENAEMTASATFADRQQRLCAAMADDGIDLAVVFADVWRPGTSFT